MWLVTGSWFWSTPKIIVGDEGSITFGGGVDLVSYVLEHLKQSLQHSYAKHVAPTNI